jgi:type IV secretion system protein VirB4
VIKNFGPIPDLYGVIEPYDDFFALTKNTGLIGAIELSGRDPDGLDMFSHAALSAISQRINGKLDRNITITEYYSHYDGEKISLRPRESEISNTLSKQREAYLNSKNISKSSIIHYFEIEPTENINNLNIVQSLKHLGMSLFDARSRTLLKNSISADNTFYVELNELDRLRSALQDAIDEVQAKWRGLFEVKQLDMQEIWAHMRFLASMNPDSLKNALHEAVPDDDMDIYLSPGDMTNVVLSDMDVLKISGVTNQYVRMAAVRRFTNQRSKMTPGVWAANEKSPCRVTGNYIIMTRWKPLTEFQKEFLFNRKQADLERATLNFTSMLSGGENRSVLEKQASTKNSIKIKMEELDVAEAVPDIWGEGHSYICIFDTNREKLRATSIKMDVAASNSKINLTWESVSIETAFKSFQPGQRRASNRNLFLTSSQFAAASLIYQSSKGQEIVPDMNDEATYVFKSKDDQLFYYSSMINGKSLTIAVGPIRSGKTFTKNTIATHFQKYGGIYRAIDIDPGTEAVAGVFGDDAGVFSVDNRPGHGSNIFASYIRPEDNGGNEDTAFKTHLNAMMQSFLRANDSKGFKTIEDEEQKALDEAINKTLRLPKELQSLSALVSAMPKNLKQKFARWVRNDGTDMSTEAGWYAHLFDAQTDAIGGLNKPIGVFNLQALKANSALLEPVQMDILYRITQIFEDPKIRHKPKMLDWDEVHHALKIPGFAEFIEVKARTWGKWFASLQMWTQSPQELLEAHGWEALRSAATTFLFMADSQMDLNVYRKAFPFLTDGELEAIKNLIPRSQAYIIQPELGVSKVIIIDVEPEQHVVNTSHPREAAIRDRLIQEHGFETGLKLAVEEIAKLKQPAKAETGEIVVSRLRQIKTA